MNTERTALVEKPCASDTVIKYRHPRLEDGAAIWKSVEKSNVLDSNSTYLYLLLCHHFSDTCFVAEFNGTIVGFLSSYIPPNNPTSIFVWQIAVHSDVRRRGVALAMLNLLVDEIVVNEIPFLEASITPSNTASRKLFGTLADNHGVECVEEILFTSESFGKQFHEEEILFRLGPFSRSEKSEVQNENI